MQEDNVAAMEWDWKGDKATEWGGADYPEAGRQWEEFWICCKFNEKSEKDFNQERDMSWYWAKEVALTDEDKEEWIV